MVIERFRDVRGVYRRLRERGRQQPEGLVYLDSWIAEDLGRCFQLMETEERALLEAWMQRWSDLMDFEVVPVLSSAEASRRALGE